MRKILIVILLMIVATGCKNYQRDCATDLKYIRMNLDELQEMRRDCTYAPVFRKIKELQEVENEDVLMTGDDTTNYIIDPSFIDRYKSYRTLQPLADKMDSINLRLMMIGAFKRKFLQDVEKVNDLQTKKQLLWIYDAACERYELYKILNHSKI